MRPESPKLITDIQDASACIILWVANRTLPEYAADRMLRQAIERNFEIIGEAINRLRRVDPQTADRIGEYPQIIAFRNILAPGYDFIDPAITWGIIQGKLHVLKQDVDRLLAEAP
jgi:uncharacterized protein with HEPN domain